ncbi:hypothetical protein BGZ76_000927 [Entomortierella beljakovae]|nr:hypothetical protein BGZ76_000927 [Entomortierella beljakovae]
MGFFQLFEESEVDMKKARVLQIIEVLSQDLRKLNAIVLENTPLIASRRHMVSWTQHLSGLCAPLVSFSVAEKLVEGVINLSYSLKDGSKHTSQTNLSATLLDAAFVEQVLLHSNDKNQEGGIRLDDCHLIRLCIVSDIARKRYLVQLIDSIMIASAVQPGFALRRKEIFSEFVESSQFCLSLASYLNEKGIEQIDFVQSIFEDITGMAGEIEDWRFIRICVLLMDWIMVRGDWTRGNGELSSQGSKYCSLQDDAVSMSAFDTMLLHSSSLLKYYRDHVSVEIPLDELELFMQAQQDYIYCAGPKRFHLRRRLAYLMSTAIAHHEEFIVHRMYCHFVSSEQQQHDSGANHIDDNQLIRFILCLTMPDESEQSFMSILHGQFSKLLLELQILCSDYRRQESTAILLNSIGAVFEKHKTILKLNETLLANIIYAVGSNDNISTGQYIRSLATPYSATTRYF